MPQQQAPRLDSPKFTSSEFYYDDCDDAGSGVGDIGVGDTDVGGGVGDNGGDHYHHDYDLQVVEMVRHKIKYSA